MSLLRIFIVVALAWGGMASAQPSPVRHATPVAGVYAGAIVIDASTGRVLIEDNPDVRNPPASMTKLMTFAVVHDSLTAGTLTLQTPVKIEAADARMGGTQVYLDPRETFTVEELLYALMVQSANDAAHALARAAAGSVPVFVDLMNTKARELGMTRTTFRTPHGLPAASRRVEDGDLSTPRDFAVLSRHLLKHTDVLRYTAVQERDFGAERKQGALKMRNHNNLLGKIPGVDGLKTGYTRSAGYCLSATAERSGRRIVAVIMGSFGPGGEVDRGRARDLKMIQLIDRGFALGPDLFTADRAAVATPASSSLVPVVKTDKTVAPPSSNGPAEQQTSTPTEPMFKFRVIPPEKKP